MNSRTLENDFQEATPVSPTRGEDSVTALVAIVASSVILLLMLTACSSAHAEEPSVARSDADVRALTLAVPMETLTVVPAPEDLPAPVKGRWQRFNEVLDASSRRGYRVVETTTNDGVRSACYEPCAMNCCVTSGGFSLTGHGFGR